MPRFFIPPDEYDDDPENREGHLSDYEDENGFSDYENGSGPEPDEPRTHSDYRLIAQGQDFDSLCRVSWWTDDNDDDGWPGPDDSAQANYRFESVWAALNFCNGGSRIGCIGCIVTVRLDGSIIYTEEGDWRGPEKERYRPYCEWPSERRRATDE